MASVQSWHQAMIRTFYFFSYLFTTFGCFDSSKEHHIVLVVLVKVENRGSIAALRRPRHTGNIKCATVFLYTPVNKTLDDHNDIIRC